MLGALWLASLMAVAVFVAVSIHPRGVVVPLQPASPGKIVLTVESEGQPTLFDMRTLEALPQRTYHLTTPWYLRPVSFQGPLMRDVLANAGVRGTHIEAIAMNGFTADIPFAHAEAQDAIVALRMDGKPMSARDKGPLFMIYPYDRLPEGERDEYFARSVWQLDVLRVK
ncbi:MAG: molybdopterin-dependent oxidoreductase [Burkholderiaceae bacterium]